MELRNIGRSAATNLLIAVEPSERFQQLTERATIALLASGQATTITFDIVPASTTLPFTVRVVFDDATDVGRTRSATFTAKILTVPTYSKAIPNLYQPGTPLRPDSPIFFGREEYIAAIRDTFLPAGVARALVLTGRQRMGKTSLLRQLGQRLGPTLVPVYLDLQGLALDPGMPAFFADLADALATALGIPAPTASPLAPRRPSRTSGCLARWSLLVIGDWCCWSTSSRS